MILRLIPAIAFLGSMAMAQENTIAERILNRDYPSVFQAWNGAVPLPGADEVTMRAMHDLVFVHPTMMGLRSATSFEGTAFEFTPQSLTEAKARRAALLAKNPRLVLLAEVRYRDAPKGFIPEDAAWWKRDGKNEFVMGWAEGGYRLLDVEQADWQIQVARRAKAVMETGVFDGVMLDWWIDDDHRLSLIRRVREQIGENALVLVNANDRQIPRTAAYVNGLFMECYRTRSAEDWTRISETLRWAESELRKPRINCVETWYHQSRQDLNLMRAVTTLSLTHSDGYCLFSDPNELPTPDHQHDWYAFWEKGLGRPKKAGILRKDGAWEREFSGGTAVYNPPSGSPVTLRFESPRRSRATGRSSTEHTLNANDGDLYLNE